jgi:hypothetical protein
MVGLLKDLLALFVGLLLVATFFWIWGRLGYSFWPIPLIVLFIAAGLLLARWVRQQNRGN